MNGAHITEAQLNDYLDGLLHSPEREDVADHLSICVACTNELDELRSLLTGLGSLPKAIAPGADLRPAIHARIKQPASAPAIAAPRRWEMLWPVRHQLAAAAVMLVLLSSAATMLLVQGRGRTPALPVPATATSSVASEPTLARFQLLEAEYMQAAGELSGVLEHKQQLLDPATAELLRRNLRVIDRAIAESRAALRADPQSEMLWQMIIAAHEQKLQILRRAEMLNAQT